MTTRCPASNCTVIGENCTATHDDCILIGDGLTSTRDGHVQIGETLFGQEIPIEVRIAFEYDAHEFNWILTAVARKIDDIQKAAFGEP